MIIIKHGNHTIEKRYRFICNECECEFELTEAEMKLAKTSLSYMFTSDRRHVYCPECMVIGTNVPCEIASVLFADTSPITTTSP